MIGIKVVQGARTAAPWTAPAIILSSVDFPQPEGPTKTTNSTVLVNHCRQTGGRVRQLTFRSIRRVPVSPDPSNCFPQKSNVSLITGTGDPGSSR